MDLIYTDKNRVDLGVMLAYDLDLAYGADENNFECTVGEAYHVCSAGAFLHMDGTEYGGIVDAISRDTSSGEVVYSGRTWQGILDSKVIRPDAGQDYLVVSGDANAILGTLISRLGLGDLFEASEETSGLTVASFEMPRYATGYAGIIKMLESVGGKLTVRFVDGMVLLSAMPIHDYSADEDFDSDLVDFTIQQSANTVNHLICLGSGDLKDRMVVDLYADADGNISDMQTFTGLEEYTAVLDSANTESEEELIKAGTEKLQELFGESKLEIDFGDDTDAYDIGDIVGAYDNVTKISVRAKVQKKIVTVQNGRVSVAYTVGGLENG